MKKKALLRGLLGVPLGMAMGYLITIVISLGWGQGRYVACMPELEAQGIHNFIHVKSNVLDTLHNYLTQMGI